MSQRTGTRPRIAIPLPTLARTEYNERSWPYYSAAVERCGGEPVQMPLSLPSTEIARIATSCQGILLPGCPADLNPAKYGQTRQPETAEDDAARENMDELLLQDAHNLHKPLLTICYGTQSLNVWRTGTLVQNLLPVPVNHRDDHNAVAAHTVAMPPSSRLAEIVGGSPEAIHSADFLRLGVNSTHHQAIGIPGDGLRVAARCPQDAVIEAVEGIHPDHFVLGVQWHPERSFDASLASRLIFERFVREAAGWQPRAITDSLARQ